MIKNIFIAISVLGMCIVGGGLYNAKSTQDAETVQLSKQKEASIQGLASDLPKAEVPPKEDTNISVESFVKARKQARAMRAKASNNMKTKAMYGAKSTSRTPQWEMRGPHTYGRVTAIVADPQNLDKIYVGTPLGGVWKSTDGGQHYTPIFDNAGGSLSISALALDPQNSDIIYVGTGDNNRNYNYNIGDGLWRSKDGGETWEHLLQYNSRISAIIVNPDNNANEIFIADIDSGGIRRSRDNGKTWKKLILPDNILRIRTMQMDPNNSSRLYAGKRGYGIVKSEDGGDHWTKLTQGLPSSTNITSFSLAPSSPNVLYAGYLYGNNPAYYKIYRSNDYGETWQLMQTLRNGESNKVGSAYARYNGKLIVSPVNKNTLYILDVSSYKSIDGGDNFTNLSSSMGYDHCDLWISQDGETIYSGSDIGVYASSNFGDTFTFHQSLPIGQFYAIDVDPAHHNRIFGGMQDNGTGYTTDGSDWHTILGGDGMTVLVDRNNSNIIYPSTQNGAVHRIINNFETHEHIATWSSHVPLSPWTVAFTFDPANKKVFYYGGDKLYTTTFNDDNTNKPNLTPASSKDFGLIYDIDIPVSGNGKTIYLATHNGVWLSKDKASSWENIMGRAYHITADPKNDAIAYASGVLYKTTDYGQTWTNISSNLPQGAVKDVLVDPDYSSTLYCATDFGVYISLNTGASWSPLGHGLPEIQVNDIKIIQEGSEIILYAGTYGRGIYSVRLNKKQRRGAIGLTTSNITSHTAMLHWEESNTNHTTRYEIYQGNNTTPVATLPTGSTSYAITGLTESTGYLYSIKAFNSDGESQTAEATFKTKTYFPETPTELRTVGIIKPSSATLAWKDNANIHTGNESGYKIYKNSDLTPITTLGADITSYTLTGLDANTSYTYHVKAFNDNGESDASSTTFKTPVPFTKALIISPIEDSTLTSSTMTVAWKRNGVDYISLFIDTQNPYNIIFYGEVTGTSKTFTDIPTNGKRMRILLSSENPYSSKYVNQKVSIYQKNDKFPTAPTNLTTTNIEQSTTTLTWEDNSNNETGFYIYRSGSSTPIKVAPNVHTYNLTGLTAATDYTYSVKAYNSAGESSATTTSFKTKPAAFKKAHILSPTDGTTLTSSSMTVTWERNSASIIYLWVYDLVHRKTLHWTIVKGTSKTITNLPTNGERLRVRLYSYEGNSYKDSEIVHITAKKATPTLKKPTPPSNLTATNITTNSATLTWKENSSNVRGFKPSRGNTLVKIAGFKIYRDNTLVKTLGANVHYYHLTGLTAAQDYTYSIKAYNSAGASSATTKSFKTLTNNWHIYDNTPTGAKITHVYDTIKKSEVIQFTGSGTANGYRVGYSGDKNANSWKSKDKMIKWSMNFSENYYVFISVMTTKGHRYIYYTPMSKNLGLTHHNTYIHFGLGTDSKDGKWHTFARSLEADLKQYEPDNTLLTVNGFLVRGSGKVTDITLMKPLAMYKLD